MKKYYYAAQAPYAYGFIDKAARDQWAESVPNARKITYKQAQKYHRNPKESVNESIDLYGPNQNMYVI